ncbi:hypothetical protein Tco_1392389 [Tanacetum coccineum]
MKKEITMVKPNEYIYVTRKNFLADDDKGRMVEKSFLEIQGTFLVKIRDNTFNGIVGENAFEQIDNFLEVVGPLKIKGLSHDRFRLNVCPISLTGVANEWFKKSCIGSVTTWENVVEKFIQKFYQLSDDQEEMETDEDDDPDNIAKIDHKWYDELTDGKLKEEALMHKAKIEESWGDATPGNVGGRDYGSNNTGNIQDNMKEYHNPSIYKIRRFEMIKYSFNVDDEYVAIKEREHSRTDIDACQAYRELFRIMDEGWFVTKAKEE